MILRLQFKNRGLEIRRTKNYVLFIVLQPAPQNKTKSGNLFSEKLQLSYANWAKRQFLYQGDLCYCLYEDLSQFAHVINGQICKV